MARVSTTASSSSLRTGVWTDDEHERFREALELFPNGPWKSVAAFVGTRSVRQVQTHAQKYHEKAARRLRDLHKHRARQVAPNVLIDFEMQGLCHDLHWHRVLLSPRMATEQATETDQHLVSSCGPVDADDELSLYEPWNAQSFDECLDFLATSLDACSETDIDLDTLDASTRWSRDNGVGLLS